MVLIERILARIVEFIACDLFLFDSEHVTQARRQPIPVRIRPDTRQTIHRFRGR